MIKVSLGSLGDEELNAVKEAFEIGYFGLGIKVVEFETQFTNYLGTRHVVATSSGTAALHLALDGLGIGPGDEVIVPSLTFVGCFQSISATGATPIPCEIDPATLLLDLKHVRSLITPKTKAIMPVHYAGNPCDMDALFEIRNRNGIHVIEDAAHALGSTYKGRKIGSFGDIVCFSFDSIKNISCGEGGAVVCFDESLAERIRYKRLLGINRKAGLVQGSRWLYQVTTQGYRYHMSNINAAIGSVQLKRLESFISRRREICRRYDAAFRKLRDVKILSHDYSAVAPHIYVIRVMNERRNELMDFLKDRGIETGINYIPNHLQPFYANKKVKLPATEMAYLQILTLPLHVGLSNADVELAIETILDFFKS